MNSRFHYKVFLVHTLALVFLASVFGAGNVYAQSALTASDISMTVAPENPQPNQDVTITLTSYSVDLNLSQITWYQDGKLKSNANGIKTFSVRTPDVGVSTTIRAVIKSNSATFEKQVVITPSEFDMLWEALDSYVPPFYEGKALPSSEATIKVVALPNAKSANGGAGAYSYNWKKNYTIDQRASGYGKNTFTFKASYLNKEETISVNATSQTTGGEASITIVPGKPKVVFYEESPLQGTLFAQALNNGYRLTSQEASIVAEPYFFSVKDPNTNEIAYKWSINNNKIETPLPKNLLVVRGGENGRAKVGLELESVTKLFQLTTQSFYIDIIK